MCKIDNHNWLARINFTNKDNTSVVSRLYCETYQVFSQTWKAGLRTIGNNLMNTSGYTATSDNNQLCKLLPVNEVRS